MSKKPVKLIIIFVAVIAILYSSYHLYTMFKAYSLSGNAHEEIRLEALEAPADENGLPKVNFDTLSAINPDIIGWLYIPDTVISYPILCGSNNQRYLTTTYDGRYSVLGSIFQDYRNAKDFKDLNTVIYGHRTGNGTMFGGIKQYKKVDFAEAHKDIYILTKNETLVYEAFSIYETLATSDTYIILFESDKTYGDYLSKMRKQSIIEVGTVPTTEHIITLSTCTGSDKTKRLVLQARFVEAIPVEFAP